MEFLLNNIEKSTIYTKLSLLSFLIGISIWVIKELNKRRKWALSSIIAPNFKIIPTPPKLPLIGHLHLLNGEQFVQMTKLYEEYGEIYFLQLGTIKTVVVTSFRLMKQVLVEKGGDFGDRCGFTRYHTLFGNDKENSLAFCNWSQVQKTRRSLARRFCHSSLYADLAEKSINEASDWLSTQLKNNPHPEKNLKKILNEATGNAFFGFFCSSTFEERDAEFSEVIQLFDEIFYEINQSHPTDVLPFLSVFYAKHLRKLANMGTKIRQFVVERIIKPHLERLDVDNPVDFVDILLIHLEEEEGDLKLTMDQVLYELEDFLGGHSAVSNLLVRALIEISQVPHLSRKIYKKCIVEKDLNYMQAIIHETLRKTSSPIVPHVASTDTSIDGYEIKKGTMMILNNYYLNSSSDFWVHPHTFNPDRFLTENGSFRKPPHFIPFSSGKRACMGYKLVEKVTEGLLHAIFRDYDVVCEGEGNILPKSCVAVHPQLNIRIKLIPRIN